MDLALQAAMIHTRRRGFLSLEGSYHGNPLAGLSIGASDNREQIQNLLPHCGKIAAPLDAKALGRIEQRLKRRDVAAFVMEPISINLGVLIPEKDAIRRVCDLCRRYGTLFIADEVACGFGRTGRVFACERLDVDPDMLCVAKAMGGGLAPIRALIATAPIVCQHGPDGTRYLPASDRGRTGEAFGPVTEDPKKTSIHLIHHVTFAGVATRRSSLILTLKSASDIRNARILKREQTSAHRWHLEVRLEKTADIDQQVTTWLRAAYDLAAPQS